MKTLMFVLAFILLGYVINQLARSREESDLEEFDKNKYDYLKNQLK